MIKPLEGKIALITGASSGIGRAAALALSAAGAQVAVSARRADRLNGLVEAIDASGGKALALPGDVSEESVAHQVVERTIKSCGGLDILVNSAGIIQAGGVTNANTEEWRRIMDVNFFGTLYCCKAVIGHMRERGSGDIINVSSISGRRSAVRFGGYSPSKFAVNSLSEGLRQEVGALGIRVCVIEPGATESEVAEGISDPVVRDSMREYVTRAGAMKAEDVAEAIVFIASLPPRANVSELLIRPTLDIAPL